MPQGSVCTHFWDVTLLSCDGARRSVHHALERQVGSDFSKKAFTILLLCVCTELHLFWIFVEDVYYDGS